MPMLQSEKVRLFLSFQPQSSLVPRVWPGTSISPGEWVGNHSCLSSAPCCLLFFLFTEFFIDGLGSLLVGSCPGVTVDHQTKTPSTDPQLVDLEKSYARYRTNVNSQMQFKLALHYFKNHLYCST